MEDLCDAHINSFSSSFQTISIRSSVFSIFQFIGGHTLFHVTILKQTYKRKNNFQDGKEYNHKNHF